MRNIAVLTNSIQSYAWGSRTAIAELLGQPIPSETPQAELWMGAHPKAPSMVPFEGALRPLNTLIATYPLEILGSPTTLSYGHQLPYLFKVLAADAPLSIQAHPDAAQALAGYAAENRMGIALDAPERNYKDDRNKPECICALTPFWGLCGFRSITEIFSLVSRLCPQSLLQESALLREQADSAGLKRFFQSLMTLDRQKVIRVIQEAASRIRLLEGEEDAADWIVRLRDAYPEDIGVIFPAILNLVQLQPGEALFLTSGELHAYLRGVGIEIMANSDNVLRGGLTGKHVDVPELLRVLSFQAHPVQVLQPEPYRPHETIYRTPAAEFALSVISLSPGDIYQSPARRSADILLATEGQMQITEQGSRAGIGMTQGVSVIVPAIVPQYRISGKGVIFKAAVPLDK